MRTDQIFVTSKKREPGGTGGRHRAVRIGRRAEIVQQKVTDGRDECPGQQQPGEAVHVDDADDACVATTAVAQTRR